MKRFAFGLVALFGFGGLQTAQGGFITDESSFTAAATRITFDGAATTGAALTYSGVTFSAGGTFLAVQDYGTFFSNVPGGSRSFALNDSVGLSNIQIAFGANEVYRAGLWLTTGVSTTWTLTAFDTLGGSLGSQAFTGGGGFGTAVFAGFESPTRIGSFLITESVSNGNITVLDDVRFEGNGAATPAVPEPGSMTLLGLGTLGMLGYRFKRRKTEPAPVAAA